MPIRKRRKLKLGEILSQIVSLNEEQLKEALYLQTQSNPAKPIGQILIEKGYASREDVEIALGLQEGYPYISAANYNINSDTIEKIPSDLVWEFYFIPLDIIGDILTIATSSVSGLAIDKLEELGFKVRIFLSSKKEIEEALRRYFG